MEKDQSVLSETTAADLAEFFSSFSDSSRIRIISALANCELNVGELAEKVSLSESATSHHLRGLRQKHLVRTRKEGRQVYYCLDDEHILGIYQMGLNHIIHQ